MKKRRVRLRPKVRRRRRSLAAGVLVGVVAAAALGGVAAVKPWRTVELPRLTGSVPLPGFTAVDNVVVEGGGPELTRQVFGALAWRAGDRWGLFKPGRLGGGIAREFSCVRRVRHRRSWARREVTFELLLRRPVARVTVDGADAGLLSDAGVRFTAPAELIGAEALPSLELAGLPEGEDLPALARLIAAARAPGALPVRLASWRYAGAQAGWTGALENGIRLQWGTLRWTEEKFRRLGEVLADAAPRFGEAFTADLRHFEDGKILVRMD